MNIDYPNPVLSFDRDDYNENCVFDVSFKEEDITVDEKYINIPAVCELKCDGLLKVIKEGLASVVVLISSPSGFYRRTFEFEKDSFTIIVQIPKFDVKKDIHFRGYVLARTDIKGFRCEGEFNDLYFHSMPFDVKKGDVLAEGRTRVIPIDDSELEKPISSIFQICWNHHSDAEIEPFFEEEKIVIYLSEHLNQLYWTIKDFGNGELIRYLNGIIIYPVLVEAIAKMCDFYKNCGTDYSEKRWFRAIDQKLKASSIELSAEYDDRSCSELANMLLGNIAYDGLINIKTTIHDEANNGESVNLGGKD